MGSAGAAVLDAPALWAGAVAAALAAALLAAPGSGESSRWWGRTGGTPLPSRAPLVLVTGATGGLAMASGLVGGLTLVLLALGAAVCVVVLRAWRAVRARQVVEDRRTRVLEACEGLAADLRAGQPPQRALSRATASWPELRPVVVAAEVGADVPAAMRALAATPGAEQLEEVAAGWQVAHESGVGLAPVLARVVRTLRARRRTARLVAGEVATARATAVVLAALPVPVLALSAGLGGDPVGFLTGTVPGVVCLSVGLLLSWAGWWWLDRIASGVLGR